MFFEDTPPSGDLTENYDPDCFSFSITRFLNDKQQ